MSFDPGRYIDDLESVGVAVYVFNGHLWIDLEDVVGEGAWAGYMTAHEAYSADPEAKRKVAAECVARGLTLG